MTTKEKFDNCRATLWRLLSGYDWETGCKSYEGAIEINHYYPRYWDSPDSLPEPESVTIRLHCYVLGPARHYEFSGKTLNEACESFDAWLSEIEGLERQYD